MTLLDITDASDLTNQLLMKSIVITMVTNCYQSSSSISSPDFSVFIFQACSTLIANRMNASSLFSIVTYRNDSKI
jgi:hypothetical protein